MSDNPFAKYIQALNANPDDIYADPYGGLVENDPSSFLAMTENPEFAPVPGGTPVPDTYAPNLNRGGQAPSMGKPSEESPAGRRIGPQPSVGSMSRPGYAGPAPVSGENGQAITDYITQAARKRGIDPDVALRIADAEGGRGEYAKEGKFNTGRSYWAFQLHYGGAGTPYAGWGNTAGMGNDFTERTGYQPGDPAAWQAAIDFALDHAARYGWGAWYGRKTAGVGEWDGIPR